MTDQEIRDTLRQMLKDWSNATPGGELAALLKAREIAEGAVEEVDKEVAV